LPFGSACALIYSISRGSRDRDEPGKLGEALGVTFQQVQKYEKGVQAEADIETCCPVDLLCSSAPELSNNIIQKGLAFIGGWSGTIVSPGVMSA